ncbi:T9SS type A sorting domain-containing protein [Winogradskyella sp. PC D3.3]
MKNIYVLLFTLLSFALSQAQIVNIPDSTFKNALLNRNVADLDGDHIPDGSVDTNGDSEIQVSEALAVKGIILIDSWFSSDMESFEGIEEFVNLTYLSCPDIGLNTLDLSSNVNLKYLNCSGNDDLVSLDLTQNTNLEVLTCKRNYDIVGLDLTQNTNLVDLNLGSLNWQFNAIDLTQNTNLVRLITEGVALEALDLTQNINLEVLAITGSPLITLDLSQNVNLIELDLTSSQNLTSIDVSNNLNLEKLTFDHYMDSLNPNTVDVSNNLNLRELNCTKAGIDFLDVSNNINLERLYLAENNLTELDVSNLVNLEYLYVEENKLEVLDITHNPNITRLDCSENNSALTQLYLKNGVNWQDNGVSAHVGSNNALQYACINDYNNLYVTTGTITTAGFVYNSYCSFDPGGDFFEISGNVTLDLNANGCDVADISFPELKFDITDGSNNGTYIANTSGQYYIPVGSGSHTVTPVLENPSYFDVSPSSFTVDFPTDGSAFIQDFCVTPVGVKNDLEIVIMPYEQARPGFDTYYGIIYKNKGNTTLSGMLSLNFQDELMDLVSSNPAVNTQTIGNLSWNFSDLQPFETRSVHFTMNINTPTDPNFPVNGNDVLSFTSNISPLSGDETPEDNVFILNQNVVNSYDPNDKTCLEGDTIDPSEVGDYVHYMIRFENTGSASAVNIVVKDEIDKFKYDISTLKPVMGSHDFVTRIKDTDVVEFIFEDINLPEDDANNDGYVAFKIKTWSTLDLGDIFRNSAEIYFDYNAPIITNTAMTIVEESLFVNDFNIEAAIKLYPNPVSDYLFIESNVVIESIKLHDINGRLLQDFILTDNQFEEKLNISKLNVGVYFVKIASNKGDITKKFIKE